MRACDNPFRTDRIGNLTFRSPSGALDALWLKLQERNQRGAIVGPRGSGKTTLLNELAARYQAEGQRVVHWFMSEDRARPSLPTWLLEARSLGARDVLLLDGAGHLSGLAWHCIRSAARRAGGLVVTAHAPGLLPTLLETSTDAALLNGLARELIGPDVRELTSLLDELCRRRTGNLREVFLDLYDLAAHDDPRLASLRGS